MLNINNINISIRRLASFIVDIIILTIAFSAVQYVMALHLMLFSDTDTLSISNIIFGLTCIYFIIGDSIISNNATIGKKLFRIRLVTSQKIHISLLQTSVRTIILFLSPWLATNLIPVFTQLASMPYESLIGFIPIFLIVYITLFLITPLSILFGNGTEGIHDKLCKVVVISRKTESYQHSNSSGYGFIINSIFISIIISAVLGIVINIIRTEMLSFKGYKKPTASIIIDAKNDLSKIYGPIPEKYIIHGFNMEGEVFRADIKKSITMRENIGKKLGLPFYAKDIITGFNFTKGTTENDLYLFKIYENEENKRVVVSKGTTYIKSDITLSNDAIKFKEVYARIINSTINNITETIIPDSKNSIIVITLRQKSHVGWINIELKDEYYWISGIGIYRDEYSKTRAITANIPFTMSFDQTDVNY